MGNIINGETDQDRSTWAEEERLYNNSHPGRGRDTRFQGRHFRNKPERVDRAVCARLDERPPLMRLRTLRHITQKQLADALGVTEDTVANWERGRAVPKLTVRQFKTLLSILEIGPDQLPDDFGPPSQSTSQLNQQLKPVAIPKDDTLG